MLLHLFYLNHHSIKLDYQNYLFYNECSLFCQLKQKIRKEAIELTKHHLRQNNQKAYEVKDEDLEKLIKKKESRLRQKYWKMILRFGVIHGLGLSWLGI